MSETTVIENAPETTTPAPAPEKPRKWASNAGPIQTKRVNEALSKITWEGRTFKELSGVKGIDEHECCFTSPFSPPSEASVAAFKAIGDKFSWVVTRSNYLAIIECAGKAVAELAANRPIKDSRRTPEADAQLRQEREAAEAQRLEKEQKKEREAQGLAVELRTKYPWAIKDVSMREHARAAANAKTELGMLFPGVEFSCRSDYNSIRVSYSFGPTSREVEAALSHYRNGRFDGQTDSHEHDYSALGEAYSQVLGRVQYVSVSREFPPITYTEVGQMICALKGLTWGGLEMLHVNGEADTERLSYHVHTLLHRTSMPARAKIVEVLPCAEGEDEWCKLSLEVPPKVIQHELAPPVGANGVVVRHNVEHNGVEISFPCKPSSEVLARLKVRGFRWAMRNKVWYNKLSPTTWAVAHEVVGLPVAPMPSEPAAPGPDRFDMAVEDQMKEQCGL